MRGRARRLVHVDGAFGLWAAASPRYKHLVAGRVRADSWAVDAQSGSTFRRLRARDRQVSRDDVPGADAKRRYLARSEQREPAEFVPEASRRARAIPVYAALRTLGRQGVAKLVDRCCAHATLCLTPWRQWPGGDERGRAQPGPRWPAPGTLAGIQADGMCWLGGTTWRARDALARRSRTGHQPRPTSALRPGDPLHVLPLDSDHNEKPGTAPELSELTNDCFRDLAGLRADDCYIVVVPAIDLNRRAEIVVRSYSLREATQG